MDENLPPIPALLQAARGAYGAAIRRDVAQCGFEPLPPNGAFVIGALHYELSREDIMHERGRAIERGQVISRLEQSGYVVDDEEGLHLTAKGHECSHVVRDATSGVTSQLVEAVGEENFEHFLRGLMTLIELREAAEQA